MGAFAVGSVGQLGQLKQRCCGHAVDFRLQHKRKTANGKARSSIGRIPVPQTGEMGSIPMRAAYKKDWCQGNGVELRFAVLELAT